MKRWWLWAPVLLLLAAPALAQGTASSWGTAWNNWVNQNYGNQAPTPTGPWYYDYPMMEVKSAPQLTFVQTIGGKKHAVRVWAVTKRYRKRKVWFGTNTGVNQGEVLTEMTLNFAARKSIFSSVTLWDIRWTFTGAAEQGGYLSSGSYVNQPAGAWAVQSQGFGFNIGFNIGMGYGIPINFPGPGSGGIGTGVNFGVSASGSGGTALAGWIPVANGYSHYYIANGEFNLDLYWQTGMNAQVLAGGGFHPGPYLDEPTQTWSINVGGTMSNWKYSFFW